jgi:hypothetical protein
MVASWYIFIPKFTIWVNFWVPRSNQFTAVWYIWWPTGILCGHFVYVLSPFWYFAPWNIWQPWFVSQMKNVFHGWGTLFVNEYMYLRKWWPGIVLDSLYWMLTVLKSKHNADFLPGCRVPRFGEFSPIVWLFRWLFKKVTNIFFPRLRLCTDFNK